MTINPRWPFPGDGTAERARKVALVYRQHLHQAAPDTCATVDRMVAGYGELWAVPHTVVHADGDLVTTSQAADMVGVSRDLVRHWARLPHPDHPDRPLLARAGRRGRETTYRAADVYAAHEAYRRR